MSAQPMLHGITVVDLTTIVFGPYATQMLADMGAEVVKVETADGDQLRQFGKSKKTRRMGPAHMIINRGKRSIALNLKAEADAEVMRRLLKRADVFIHNVRPAAIDRLGFGYDAVKDLRPDIIYAQCVGYASNGPYAGLPAYDDVIQAASGAATLLPRVDGNPNPRYLPSLIADKVAGLYGAQAVLAAIVHRLRTGEGQRVEIPMFEAFTHFMLQEHLFGAVFDSPIDQFGYPRQLEPFRQPFPTSDGHLSIVPYTSEAFARLFEVLGGSYVLEQEHFATRRLQAQNIGLLYGEIAKFTPARTTADWVARLNAANIPCMPVRDLSDMLDDPHLLETSFFHRRIHPTEGDYLEMPLPIRFGAHRMRDLRPAPALDGDGDAIRAELGLPVGLGRSRSDRPGPSDR